MPTPTDTSTPNPIGWPTQFELPEAIFEKMSLEQTLVSRELRGQIWEVLSAPDGINLVINALIASGGDGTIGRLHAFLVAVHDIDERDLVTRCSGAVELTYVSVSPPHIKQSTLDSA